jgi:hypothetical protein
MLDIYEIMAKFYKILDSSIILIVWVTMLAVCILMWYFVFEFMFSY